MSELDLCDDCPPPDYPTDKTRCLPCPRRGDELEAPRRTLIAELEARGYRVERAA